MESITISLLEADSRNANICSSETLSKLKTHIKKSGNYPALIVRPSDKKYVIINGHHRLQVLQELNYEEKVKCEIWDVDKKEAALLLAILNRLRGEDEQSKRAKLIQELTINYSVDELVK